MASHATRVILVAGDSHTWGQGSGGEGALGELVAGELRPLDFACPSYVNLLRRRVNAATGSGAAVYPGAVLAEGEELALPGATLYRLWFRGQERPSRAEVYLDGRLHACADLTMARSNYMYRFVPVRCPGNAARLELRSAVGTVELYCAEAYDGPFAVINAGIGSCPLQRYLTPEIWENWITPWQPAAVIAEGNTINDWLAGESPDAYAALLRRELGLIRAMGARPFLHTVAPILGPQAEPYSPYRYPELVKAMRRVAKEEGVPLADANQRLTRLLAGLPEERWAETLFADPWHPNPRGHGVYAEALYELLGPFLAGPAAP